MIKKRHTLILVIFAIILTGSLLFFKNKQSNLNNNSNNSDFVVNQSSTESDTNVLQNSDDSFTYNGEYFSFTYPENWYHWEPGRHVNLELFTIHSISLENLKKDETQKFSSITIDVLRKDDIVENIPQTNKTIGVDGIVGFIINEISDSTFYSRTIMLEKNEIIYKISLGISADSPEELEQLKTKNLKIFESILKAFKFEE